MDEILVFVSVIFFCFFFLLSISWQGVVIKCEPDISLTCSITVHIEFTFTILCCMFLGNIYLHIVRGNVSTGKDHLFKNICMYCVRY